MELDEQIKKLKQERDAQIAAYAKEVRSAYAGRINRLSRHRAKLTRKARQENLKQAQITLMESLLDSSHHYAKQRSKPLDKVLVPGVRGRNSKINCELPVAGKCKLWGAVKLYEKQLEFYFAVEGQVKWFHRVPVQSAQKVPTADEYMDAWRAEIARLKKLPAAQTSPWKKKP